MSLFDSLWQVSVALADQTTVAAPAAVQATGDLTDIIHQAYNAAMMFGGLLAFLMILYAGAKYVFEPGSSSAQGDAKDQIWQAFLGLLLLFGIYIILNTINPDLTKLRVPTLRKIQVPAEVPVRLLQSTSTGPRGTGGPNSACGAFCPTGKLCNAQTRQCEWQIAQDSTCNPNSSSCPAGQICAASGGTANVPLWSCRARAPGETESVACSSACGAGTACVKLEGFAPACVRVVESYLCSNCRPETGKVCVQAAFGYICSAPQR